MQRRTLTFVTSNEGKVREAASALAPWGIDVAGLKRPTIEIQADTLEEVARSKVASLKGVVDPPFFVEDAGLFVDALHGFPGVYSAYVLRTLGCPGILRLIPPGAPRGAHFGAVVAYVPKDGALALFRGECPGTIASTISDGGKGFGFDPIFVPEGHEQTFAQLDDVLKNRISHRGRALASLATALGERAHVA
ncbi:MAG: RdgB/HAM1 family non-canonical purine NTP pyrophosphatase [Thermoplasmatota archaeon]